MTDVKKLLAEATPLPWRVGNALNGQGRVEAVLVAVPTEARLDGIVADTGTFPDRQAKPDARLIEYAVNHLPDYEALREIVEAMWDSVENDSGPSSLAKDLEWEQRWSNVSNTLARLRGEA